MGKIEGCLVYTGDILKRGGDRFDVLIADENVFVVCRRKKYYGKETGVTSYRSPEIYSNDPRLGGLARTGFTLDGTWLSPESPLGRTVAKQRATGGRSAKTAEVFLPAETANTDVSTEEDGEE